MLREILCEIFTEQGACVYEASNGAIAYSYIMRHKLDVIISDAQMPGVDGLTLAKKITEFRPPRPLMFICSGYDDISQEMQKELAIVKVFEKPFNHKQILEDIYSELKKIK